MSFLASWHIAWDDVVVDVRTQQYVCRDVAYHDVCRRFESALYVLYRKDMSDINMRSEYAYWCAQNTQNIHIRAGAYIDQGDRRAVSAFIPTLIQELQRKFPSVVIRPDIGEWRLGFSNTVSKIDGILLEGAIDVPLAWYWAVMFMRSVALHGPLAFEKLCELEDSDDDYDDEDSDESWHTHKSAWLSTDTLPSWYSFAYQAGPIDTLETYEDQLRKYELWKEKQQPDRLNVLWRI